nr:Chain C, hexapeptide [Human immunodeficiency virus 1]
YDQIII